MKASEQYFPMKLFIMLYMVVLTINSVYEILKFDHSLESYKRCFSILLSVFLYFKKPNVLFQLWLAYTTRSQKEMFSEHSPKTCVPLDRTL